jgi:hypothetical protein
MPQPVYRSNVIREGNVVRVDFRREPDPPAPRFPGAAAMRIMQHDNDDGAAPEPRRLTLAR